MNELSWLRSLEHNVAAKHGSSKPLTSNELWLLELRIKSTRILASIPDALWDMCKSSIGSSPLRSTFPQRNQAEITLVWNESNFHINYCQRDFIQHSSLWSNETQDIICKCKIGINWNFGNKPFFFFISSDSCHKMLLKSLNIPLSTYWLNGRSWLHI